MDQRDDFIRTSLRIPKNLWERLGEAAGRKRSLNAEIIERLEASFAPRDLFELGKALDADPNDPNALAYQRLFEERNWLASFEHHAKAAYTDEQSERWARFLLDRYLSTDSRSTIADAIAEKVAETVDLRLADAVLEEPGGRRIFLQIKHSARPSRKTAVDRSKPIAEAGPDDGPTGEPRTVRQVMKRTQHAVAPAKPPIEVSAPRGVTLTPMRTGGETEIVEQPAKTHKGPRDYEAFVEAQRAKTKANLKARRDTQRGRRARKAED